MKRTSTLIMVFAAMFVAPQLQAVEFAYEAGAELVSSYLWRGQYNGGLSFQPDLEIGYDGDISSLRVGVWGSVGASDWKFQKGLPETEDGNPNTYFVPELDIVLNYNVAGFMIGATHYYYFGGSPFFNWGKFDPKEGSAGTSQTEVMVGYDFRNKCELPLTITWNTMVAGDDLIADENGDYKRAFSTYIEAKYDQPLPLDMTLSLALGISPWKSGIYNLASWNEETGEMDIHNFAVNNISVRLEKEWEFDACTLSLFGQGMLNTCGLNKDNVFVWAAGDDKLYMQKLNGTIGLGVWF